jgi:hypothetical protein
MGYRGSDPVVPHQALVIRESAMLWLGFAPRGRKAFSARDAAAEVYSFDSFDGTTTTPTRAKTIGRMFPRPPFLGERGFLQSRHSVLFKLRAGLVACGESKERRFPFPSSDDLDLVGRDPDVNLLKAFFPAFFVGLEEGDGSPVGGVNADADELVAVTGAAVLPGAGRPHRVLGDAAEAVAQLLGCLIKLFGFDEGAVVIAQR